MSSIVSEGREIRHTASIHREAGPSRRRLVKILVLAPAIYDTSPGQRFRTEQWARILERVGFQFTFVPFESEALHRVLYQPGRYGLKAALMFEAYLRRFGVVAWARRFDVVIIQREAALIGPAVIERLLARQGIPLVFDFDDAVWVPYISPANKYLSYLKCSGKTADICRMSAHIMAGNRYLADYARRYNPNVTIVPTTIDTEAYSIRALEPGNVKERQVTIGWTGSYSTLQHLDTMRGVLRKLRRRYKFQLHVIGTRQYVLDGVETVAQEWRAESEVRDLQRFDIGIMPLPDNGWTRGKCGLKLLQCMAVGTPVVGSPLGVNTEIIDNGVDGFLADTEEQWLEKLSCLIERQDLRTQIGLAGRKVVEERYSARAWVPRVKQILESAGAGAGPHTERSIRRCGS